MTAGCAVRSFSTSSPRSSSCVMLPYEILLGFKFRSETNTTNLKRVMSLNYEREAENRKLRESRENRTPTATAQRFSSTIEYTADCPAGYHVFSFRFPKHKPVEISSGY